MINIAVLGYGTVGSGVVEVITRNQESINQKAGEEINIKFVLDLRDFPGDPVQEKIVHDYQVILNDPEIEVIAEVMGGVNPAYTFVKEALLAGKSVCTSNKELVAKHGSELLQIAKDHSRNFFFEASVGGGIPIIRPLNQSLTADEIEEIVGILNGTTNYILSKMSKEGQKFEDVLKEAQELGYAERNPEADVEGFDACRKIAILASLAFGATVNYEDIYTEGITKISDKDFLYANKLGCSVKLFGKCKREGEKFFASVAPVMINRSHPLYPVEGVLNGILVRGNVIGDVMFFGSGAGKLPTASAVVSDIVDAVRHLNVTTTTSWSSKKLCLASFAEDTKKFFARVSKSEEQNVKNVFGEVEFVSVDELPDEVAFITNEMSEAEFDSKSKELSKVISRIRMDV